MNVNQKIENALNDLVDGNIWPLSCPMEELPEEYIVYNPELEQPEDFGDDTDLAWVQYMQIHWFKKGESRKPVNYIAKRREIRSRLKTAGFSLSGIQVLFEENTGYTHLCFLANIVEET